MRVTFPRAFVEYILLGPVGARRQLQDSPLLADVWTAFAAAPSASFDLLLTPVFQSNAAEVAVALDDRIGSDDADSDPNIAYVDGVVAATLDFPQLLEHVVPLTAWWSAERNQAELRKLTTEAGGKGLSAKVKEVLEYARSWDRDDQKLHMEHRLSAFDRYVALAGLILWAGEQADDAEDMPLSDVLAACQADDVVEHLSAVLSDELRPGAEEKPEALIFQVAHNRAASPAISRSVAAVKGDAARNLFSIDCSGITWAVVDSGIDRSHPAFLDEDGNQRVLEAFDFSRFRSIVAIGNARSAIRKKNLAKLEAVELDGNKVFDLPVDAEEVLKQLGENARKKKPTDWTLVERLVHVRPEATPRSEHGTHVAGIIAACREGGKDPASSDPLPTAAADGVCPDIKLYDFRILAPEIEDTEFAVIAVLQYIRHLNESTRKIVIHGANLSLSIPHEVRNYACGRTPVCRECERLIDSGVVVVAAAGNEGYQKFETAAGSFANYAAFSITDPGNADGVITVGATHRYEPHTYGVSFFSSRGPTGDGRMKPDIVAPGERISGPVLDQAWGDHDGTSMAAPHVSGAAAMLMARYPELVGQPRKIKQVLCENATDLGRERSFQGHGMLDILRALQSI